MAGLFSLRKVAIGNGAISKFERFLKDGTHFFDSRYCWWYRFDWKVRSRIPSKIDLSISLPFVFGVEKSLSPFLAL
jgi:hypothetical protein